MQKEKNRDERKTIKIVIKGHKKTKAKIREVANELEQLNKTMERLVELKKELL